jgi:hypothetical protein
MKRTQASTNHGGREKEHRFADEVGTEVMGSNFFLKH